MSKEDDFDITESLREFIEDFKDGKYKHIINNRIDMGKDHIVIDYKELLSFDYRLIDFLINKPEDFLKIFENLVCNKISEKPISKFSFRLCLPDDYVKLIREIRNYDVGKFFLIKGTVRSKSDVVPKIISTTYECPMCGNRIYKLHIEHLTEPNICKCGFRGKFQVVCSERTDGFNIVLEESPEDLIGDPDSILKKINVFVKDDLTQRHIESKVYLGARISITGILKEIHKEVKGKKVPETEIYFEANFIKVEEEFSDLKITPSEENEIRALSLREDILDFLAAEVYKGVYGFEMEKKALILSIFGGSKTIYNNIVSRADIHILLIGDPGTSKSQLLKITQAFAPKARYAAGKGASAAGLTATVEKDELIGGWSIKAGELPLSHKGILLMDELDKIKDDDKQALHEALEQQTITISKAAGGTLRCETTMIAAANPKFGRFTGFEEIYKEFNLTPTLLDRFDLIFPIQDKPDEVRDREIARVILKRHSQLQLDDRKLDKTLFKKYVILAKKLNPLLTPEAEKEIEDFFVKMRNINKDKETISITARAVPSLIRLSQAAAKINLSSKVLPKHVEVAIGLVSYWIKKVGYDSDSGTIDFDILGVGVSQKKRNLYKVVLETMKDMSKLVGDTISLVELVENLKNRGYDGGDVEEAIDMLKRYGSIYEPKNGLLKIMN